MSRTHPLRRRRATRPRPTPRPTRRARRRGCRSVLLALVLLVGLAIGSVVLLLAAAGRGDAHTFLITGVDQRAEETGPTRGDVILLLHVDPATERTVLISVPRDLWLPQPNGNTNRINTALVAGFDSSDLDAGPRYLAQTITMNFGVEIDGYFLFNFAGFIEVIDAAGGVEVDVPATIVDTAYPTADYGVQTIRFEAGRQTLDGEAALIYVRTRHQDSDFGRAARQQQVVQALATRMMHPGNWLRIPAVLAALQRNAESDVSPAQWPQLALAASYLAAGQMETLVLDGAYVTPWVTESGAQVLLPRWEAIAPALRALLGE